MSKDEEEYELKQEYLTPQSERQQEKLYIAQCTDTVIEALKVGDIKDIAHELATNHSSLARELYDELNYYKSKAMF